jgi:CDP-diacylglycerol pyrophosphatase
MIGNRRRPPSTRARIGGAAIAALALAVAGAPTLAAGPAAPTTTPAPKAAPTPAPKASPAPAVKTSPAPVPKTETLADTVGRCIGDQISYGSPGPCEVVAEFAVLKDAAADKPTNLLLVPVKPTTGIESPELWVDRAPNYFAYAWDNRWRLRGRIAAKLKKADPKKDAKIDALAPDQIGLAINSKATRGQEQLHIHIDCMLDEVRAGLDSAKAKIGDGVWSAGELDLNPNDKTDKKRFFYRVMHVKSDDLEEVNPFKALAVRLKAADEAKRSSLMAQQTLVVTGAPGGGFYILSQDGPTKADAEDRGHGENVLDHECKTAVAR